MKLHCKLPIHNTTIYETSCVKHNNDNIPKYTLQVASRLNQANGRLESIDWMSLPENNLRHFIFDAIQVIRFSTVRCVISWISPFIVNREPFSFVPWYRSIVDVSIFGVNLQKKNSEIQFDTRNHRWINCKRLPKKAESWTWPFSCQIEVKKTSYRRSNSLISRFQFHCWVGRIYAHGPITGFQLPLPIFSLFARFMFKPVFSFEMNIYVGID